jgi:signal transduction histidine kinase
MPRPLGAASSAGAARVRYIGAQMRAALPRSVRLAPAPWVKSELLAAGWELFSALLFLSVILPVGFASPAPALLFGASMLLSALLAKPLIRLGSRGYALAGAIRVVAWPLAVAPLALRIGPSALVAALAFGLMAGGVRRAIYRQVHEPLGEADPAALRRTLRGRVAESATLAGIVGGHVMVLFGVAFLRTQSGVLLRAWWELLPPLAAASTIGFTLAIRPATARIVAALAAGKTSERAVLLRGLQQAVALPRVLARVNFAFWFGCTAIGVFYFRTGPKRWEWGDAFMQLCLCALFAWGVSIYQHAWSRDAMAPTVGLLRKWTGVVPVADKERLQARMLRDFGTPLVFTASLSLLASIGLYRALGWELTARDDVNAVSSLVASFTMLVITAGGIVIRAARELSRPLARLARAADRIAKGDLGTAVPRVVGPAEITRLRDSVERMREGLARTIDELSRERAGLEANVLARTEELQRALDELRRTQSALIHGERLATTGQLVAGLAHEIHNPLSAIAGAAEPLPSIVQELRAMLDAYRAAEEELPAERREALAKLRRELELGVALDELVGISTVIGRGIARSVDLMQNLKNFSRASSEPLAADLHAGLDETLVLLGPRLRAANITVTRAYGELGLTVCRAGEINQIFMNLLTNAIQALESSRSTPAAELRIATRSEGGFAIATIADNGPGVPRSAAARIFDPFFTTKARGEGTGLGLSISAEIARRHGGTLTLLTSEPGRGAAFELRLPQR